MRILINECKRLRTHRRPVVSVPAAPFEPDDRPLHDALQAMDERYRLPLVLHYLEGYSLEEIAWLLRVPTGTVKSRMHAGRRKLRDILEED